MANGKQIGIGDITPIKVPVHKNATRTITASSTDAMGKVMPGTTRPRRFNWINEKVVNGVRHAIYRDVDTGERFFRIGSGNALPVKGDLKAYWSGIR